MIRLIKEAFDLEISLMGVEKHARVIHLKQNEDARSVYSIYHREEDLEILLSHAKENRKTVNCRISRVQT